MPRRTRWLFLAVITTAAVGATALLGLRRGRYNAGCCGTNPGGGRALAIVITNRGPRGASDATPYNHYSLLATFERAFGLPCLAGACDTSQGVVPMTPLFTVAHHAQAEPVPASLLTARYGLDPNGPVGAQPPVQPGADAPVAGGTPPAPTPGSWQAVPAPNLSTHDNNLAAVSAASAKDVWAVGAYTTSTSSNRALIERYVPGG